MPKLDRALRVLSLALCPLAYSGFGPTAAIAQTSPMRATSTLADIQVIAEGPDQTVFALVVSPKVGSFHFWC